MSRLGKAVSLLIVVTLTLCLAPGTPAQSKGRVLKPNVLESFDFGRVHLLPGLMHSQFVEMRDYFMKFPSDDMLYEYRLSVGFPTPPGRRLGGWYQRVQAVTFAQWLSFYARLYAITGDTACKSKTELLFDEWWKCYTRGVALHIDGCATNRNNGNNDKLVSAMLDVYMYCGRADVLEKLNVFVRWAQAAMDTSRRFGDNGTEWYTAGWPLYRGYFLTGKDEYKDYASFWEYREYWDEFVTEPVQPLAKKPATGMNSQWCHAYSHVNSFNAAAEAYRAKGDDYYLNAMKNAYDWLQNDQVFATGGYGPELEHLMPIDSVARTLVRPNRSF